MKKVTVTEIMNEFDRIYLDAGLLGLTENDPLIQARTRSEFSEADQALIKDFEDFLSWRHKK